MIIHLSPRLYFLLPLSVRAIALWPFIVLKKKESASNPTLINHEKIHLRQQQELLLIPFYVVYLVEYIFGLIKWRNHNKAYMGISFEKEAYLQDSNLNYLESRPRFAMWKRS